MSELHRHASPPPTERTHLNRMILLLNVGVLIVNFVLAFQTTDSQIGLLRSTAEAGNIGVGRNRGGMEEAALPCARVLHAIEGAAPCALTPQKVRAIYDAVRGYQLTMERGVGEMLFRNGAEDLGPAYARLGKAAREQVEIALAAQFSDIGQVTRIATEIIKACQ